MSPRGNPNSGTDGVACVSDSIRFHRTILTRLDHFHDRARLRNTTTTRARTLYLRERLDRREEAREQAGPAPGLGPRRPRRPARHDGGDCIPLVCLAEPDAECRGAQSSARVHRTPGISCEAVPAPTLAARAQGGTSACRTGAALSFVSFIPLLGGFAFSSASAVHTLRCSLPTIGAAFVCAELDQAPLLYLALGLKKRRITPAI